MYKLTNSWYKGFILQEQENDQVVNNNNIDIEDLFISIAPILNSLLVQEFNITNIKTLEQEEGKSNNNFKL